ncbi:MAG: serine/threonine-protein kinase [Pyrinomonadaceae bacterium]
MYCPKCKDTFEEGSRRFCPADGSRLISEAGGAESSRSGGIFANLIPKIEAISDLDENLPTAPRATSLRPENAGPALPIRTIEPQIHKPATPDPVFFELDDLDLEIETRKPVVPPAIPTLPLAAPPIGRKVQPFEIPAGHVDLSNTQRDRGVSADFDLTNPENLVNRTVKGRYFVTEFLGGDDTGLAYLADDRIVTDRKVLVRILFEDDYDEIMSSILAEERVSLSHFSHPNIARLIDSGEFVNGTNFLVTEYVDALSVSDVLTIHGQFAMQRAGRMLRQTANALNEAHQEGIIHRDIRPENLIIDACGEIEQVKVVNFGASNGDPNEYNLVYKSPEVLEGKIATVASDIYSLGVVAYEMLTGQLPYSGATEKELFRNQSAGLPVMATDLRPDLPRSVNEILDRALAFNPVDRFPKARDFGDSIFTALAEPKQPEIRVEIQKTPEPRANSESIATVLTPETAAKRGNVIELEPIVAKHADTVTAERSLDEANWRNRSPEPPETGSSSNAMWAVVGTFLILAVVGVAWYVWANNLPVAVDQPQQPVQNANVPQPTASNTEMPPLPRNVPQPPNTLFYQNVKENLKGDLLRNFVGFTLFYPKRLEGKRTSSRRNGQQPR